MIGADDCGLHKLLTESSKISLAFFQSLEYDVLALRFYEC